MASQRSPAAPIAGPPGLPLLAAVLPAVAALLAYGGSLGGGFVYDDLPAIVENPAIHAGDWWRAAFGPDHTPLANRPLACLTFVLDHAASGLDAGRFRATNLALHVANVLLLLGVVRRALLAPNLAGRFTGPQATWTAVAVAALWGSHPLGSDAVAYVTQRTTLLMSLGLLAALYAVLRDAAAGHGRWRWLAVAALALGMASKEDLVAGPLLVVLFERAFVLPSWRAARPRLGFHLSLAATWLVLLACVLAGPRNPTVGYDSLVEVSAGEWLLTQAGVLVHYLRLALWPHPLRGAYDWGIVRELAPAVLPGLAILGLLAATISLWRRRPAFAWLGALFFLLLAPTSTVLPIVTEIAAERRVYLPMLAVLVPAVLAARRGITALGGRLAAGGLAAAVVAAAILATRAHARTYASEDAFWSDAAAKNELRNGSLVAATILAGRAKTLHAQGRAEEAFALLERAYACEARMERVRLNYAIALVGRGRLADAEVVLRALVADRPDLADAWGLLARTLADRAELDLAEGRGSPADPRLAEAEAIARRAHGLSQKPAFLTTLGLVLCRQQRLPEAEQVLRRAVADSPDNLQARQNLGAVLLFAGRARDAIEVWRQLLARAPQDVDLRMNLVAAAMQLGDRPAAAAWLQEVLRLQPGHAAARAALAELQR